MKGIVIGVAVVVALSLLVLFVYSFLSIGSKCSRAEDAVYREYFLKKKQNKDNENKEEDQ